MEIVDVIVRDVGTSKIMVILALQQVTGTEPLLGLIDLREAKRRLRSTPCVAVPNVPRDVGERIKDRLERAGARVELKPVSRLRPV